MRYRPWPWTIPLLLYMTILYMQYRLLLGQILTCVDKIIPGLQNDRTKEWGKITEEGKALCEEIRKLKDRND